VFVAALLYASVIALAVAPATGLAFTRGLRAPSGPHNGAEQAPTLALPAGASLCPGSGPGAACDVAGEAPARPGQPSVPDGFTQCPADPVKVGLSSPAACDDQQATTPTKPAGKPNAAPRPSPVVPSVPQASVGGLALGAASLTLSADRSSPRSGESVILTATASASVSGTESAIEIFDQTTGTLAGACMQSSRCLVGYTAAGGVHTFSAFVTPPASIAPAPAKTGTITSNAIQVSWLGVGLKVSLPSVVGPDKPVLLTATSSIDVGRLGFVLMFWDSTAGQRLTFCSSGTSCSTMLSEPAAGLHGIVALVADNASATPASGVRATSDPVSATWLSAELSASSTTLHTGGTVYLTATSNVDLTDTPWSMGIFDQSGNLIGKACKSGRTCNAQVTLGSEAPSWYSAAIGVQTPPANESTTVGQLLRTVAQSAPLRDIQVRSAAVQPSRVLWGVDSCKPLTTDPAASGGLYPQVSRMLGAPDFWGRYLTTTPNCPGISAAEVAAAASHHLGILPIYNEYYCSAVAGYDVGVGYAEGATSAAARLGIPRGTVLVIDIEPPGEWCSGGVDGAFIEGWYDGVSGAGYAPGYYGDGTASSTFGQAWCTAVADRAEVAAGSYLWSFEPSLLGRYTKATAPAYEPNQTACAGRMVAWQYELSSGADPDVDHDEALSKLPLWYPQ